MTASLSANVIRAQVGRPSRTANLVLATTGEGRCSPHFGEYLQGAVMDDVDGRPTITRCLVSVHMARAHGSVAVFTLDPDGSVISVTPAYYTKCRDAARLTLDQLGLEDVGGTLNVETFVPEGAGMGSSTTGVVATIRAVKSAVSRVQDETVLLPSQLEAEIAVAAEKACDSIMFDCTGMTLLFEHRTGRVHKVLGGALPHMVILGFDTARAGVETDQLPRARYSAEQLRKFEVAVAMLERAIAEKSVALVGAVSTFSAIVNQEKDKLPKPSFGALLKTAESVGSAGLIVAHSGTVAGLIFDPNLPEFMDRGLEAAKRIGELGFRSFRTFTTPY